MIRTPISLTSRVVLGIVSFVCVIAGYAELSRRQHIRNERDTTIPNVSQFRDGWQKMTEAEGDEESWLWQDAKASLWRFGLGIGAGVAISFLLGMAMGCFEQVEAFFLPPLSFFSKIPPTAMLAVYFVVFGTDIRLFVAMLALGIAPGLSQSICQAVRKDVREHDIHKAYTLGASHGEVIWEVVFRQVLPRILQFIQLQIGPAMVFLIAAEWMMTDVGFGYRLRIQSRLLNMSVVYIYLILLGLSGLLLDWALNRLRRFLCPWFGE